MKKLWIVPVVATVGLLGFTGQKATWAEDQGAAQLRARLDGFHQVPPVHTEGKATFTGRINDDGTITYTLTYSGLSSPLLFADIHFGQEQNTGGILFFLCSNTKTAPTQAHPVAAPVSDFTDTQIGTVTGVVNSPINMIPVRVTVNVNGPVDVPDDTQPCPDSGTVTGTIGPNDIVDAVAQGITAGELAKVVEALRSGQTYAQIHTQMFTPGELRRQIRIHEEND
jgi:hypothetical protein